MHESRPSITRNTGRCIIGIIFAFISAGVISLYPDSFHSTTVQTWLKDINSKQLFVHIIEAENHSFYQEKVNFIPKDISNTILKLATNIQPKDIRTFLGSELPGFPIFDTEIVVAGEGTDYTTIPIESSPPMDVLLEERQIAKEKLAEVDQGEPETIPAVENKSVYIYHSHSWESFSPLLEGITNNNEAVSSNEKVNIIAVGRKLGEELEQRGIGVEQDTTNMTTELQKKNWNYTNSYSLSRELVQEAMAQNDHLNFFLDIHRDSLPREYTTTIINQKEYARLFFIVGEANKNYEQNLQVATKLHEMLNAKFPGISRGVFKKGSAEGNGVYNQDLSNHALLIEFGGVENDLTELYNSIEAFADVFSTYYWDATEVSN